MKIRAARVHRYRLPLRSEWATAAGGFSRREGWLLQLESDDGRYGHGDCAPLIGTGSESPALAIAALRRHGGQLAGMAIDEAIAALPAAVGNRAPAARCAVECALLDLLAQAADLPLADYLRGAPGKRQIAVNAALGALLQTNVDASLCRYGKYAILRACAEGFAVLKLKVGMAPVDDEIARLQAVAALLPAGHWLRLDANRAWRERDAGRFLDACNGLPVDMVEEPLANPQPNSLADPRFAALRRLQANCRFALALDESLAGGDPQAILAAPPVRRLVLKPPRCGGLLPALALARQAASAGMHCVVTSSVDSACGVLAAAHLAAALDNDLAHGLATSSWLAADTGTAAPVSGGRLTLPGQAGLGFTPTPGLGFSALADR